MNYSTELDLHLDIVLIVHVIGENVFKGYCKKKVKRRETQVHIKSK